MNPVKAAAARATHRQTQKGEITTSFPGISLTQPCLYILVDPTADQDHQALVNQTMSRRPAITPPTTHQNHRQSLTTMTRRRTRVELEIHRAKRAMTILVLAQ